MWFGENNLVNWYHEQDIHSKIGTFGLFTQYDIPGSQIMYCAFLEPEKSWETRYETNFPRFAGRNCSIVLRWTGNQKFCLFQNSCKTAPNQCQFSGFKQGKGPFKYYVSKEVGGWGWPNSDVSQCPFWEIFVQKYFSCKKQWI